jgi:tetratricopeptide (TPR) repeat protein
LFARAIELDPGFARAQAALAINHLVRALFGHTSLPEAADACRTAALTAIELDPNLGEAHGALGLVHLYFDWDWAAAEEELVQALRLGPQDALVRHGYGDYLLVMGRPEESLEQLKLGRLYNPAVPLAVAAVVGHLVFSDRYDEVEAEVNAMLRTDADIPLIRSMLEMSLWAQGRHREAADLARERLSRQSPETLEAFDRGLEESGPRGAMLAVAESFLDRPPDRRPGPKTIARYLARGGDIDRAFELLDQALERREPSLLHVHAEPDFDVLRSDPRYQDLLKKIGLPLRARAG